MTSPSSWAVAVKAMSLKRQGAAAPGHIGGTSARDLPGIIENCRDLSSRSDGIAGTLGEVGERSTHDPAYRPTYAC